MGQDGICCIRDPVEARFFATWTFYPERPLLASSRHGVPLLMLKRRRRRLPSYFIQQPPKAQDTLFSHRSWDPLHQRCHPSSLPTSTSSLVVISLPKSLFDPLILSTLLVTSTCGVLLQRLRRIIIVYESANHAELKGNSAIPLSIYRVSEWSCWVLIFLYILKPFLNYR